MLIQKESGVSPKVSVIMPSFNVGKYIEKSLLSVMNQTLKEIEIIIVDKYSTDGTREIIEKYAALDNRIRLLNDDKGSCGYSNNIAIDVATGKYIGIVETDDYIEPDMYEILYRLAEENQVDYIKSDCYEFISDRDGNEIRRLYHMLGEKNIYNKRIWVKDYPELLNYIRSMWASLYRRNFLIDKQIRFHESKGAAYQDHGFLWQIVTKAEWAMYIDQAFYHYRLDNAECSMSNPNALRLDWEELKFIKSYIMSDCFKHSDYGWFFYKKTYDILEARLLQYFYNGGVLNENLTKVVEHYRGEVIESVGSSTFNYDLLGQDVYTGICILLESKECYLKYLVHKAGFLKKQIDGIINTVKDLTVIFGCGGNGLNLYWLLVKYGLEDKIVAFCDNNDTKIGTYYFGKKVFSPEEAFCKYKNAMFVIANEKYYSDMRRQLLKIGIDRKNIVNFQYKIAEM